MSFALLFNEMIHHGSIKYTVALITTTFLAPLPTYGHLEVSTQIEHLSHALQHAPNDIPLRLRRAALYRYHGAHRKALTDLSRIEAQCPDHQGVALFRAEVYWDMRNYPAVARALGQFFDRGPGAHAAWVMRARLYAYQGNNAAATADYRRALESGNSPDLYIEFGTFLQRAGRIDDAALVYQQGIARLDGAFTLRLALIELEKSRQDYFQAVVWTDALLDTVSLRAPWLIERAKFYRSANKPQLAKVDLVVAAAEVAHMLSVKPSIEYHKLQAEIKELQ